MKQYEDKYLYEKVSRIMAKQKEGYIVIAAYKNGSGLPACEDLGVTLSRAAYPYDYTVGNLGFLNYNSDIGAYLFTAKPGAKLPPLLAQYRPLALAEAMLDVGQKTVKVQTGDTVAILTGVQYWKGLYEMLRELNEEPARINAGIVVWKINAKETVG